MQTQPKSQLGIIGFGQFGQFMVRHLAEFFELFAYDIQDQSDLMYQLSVKPATLAEISQLPIIILAVPAQRLEDVLRSLAPTINSQALVIDVSSVKVKPIKLMQRYLPDTVEIVGLHPLFGPQSGKDGIAGLSVVFCPIRTTQNQAIRDFLANKLDLKVIEISPDEHDQQMACVQGLSHLISRALVGLTLPETTLATKAYQDLLSMAQYLGSDSDELFMTIERENPYASDVRAQFIEQLTNLNQEIETNGNDKKTE